MTNLIKKRYEFSLLPKRRIIKEKIIGFWNKETAEAYHKDCRAFANLLIREKWAKCIDMTEWNPSNPKVMNILHKHVEWARKNNMAYSANIVITKIPKLQMNTMLRLGRPKRFYEFFDNEKEAFAWLKKNGF